MYTQDPVLISYGGQSQKAEQLKKEEGSCYIDTKNVPCRGTHKAKIAQLCHIKGSHCADCLEFINNLIIQFISKYCLLSTDK